MAETPDWWPKDPPPIRVPWDFDQTGGDIAVQQIYPTFDGVLDRDAHLRYAQNRRRWIREKFAMSLFEAIEQSKDPVVVSVDEQIILNYFGESRDRYKLAARLTPTQTRDVVFVNPRSIGMTAYFGREKPIQPLEFPSFMKRLKYLFTGNREDLK